MKKATLAQGNQVLNLILQSKIPSEQLQDVMGILSDVLIADVARVNREKLREVLGLNFQNGDAVLCYVEGSSAYFTTQKLSKQWGDDWNDAPYDRNARVPYKPCWHNEPHHLAERGKLCTSRCCENDWDEAGNPKWKIIKVTWEGPLATPAELISRSGRSSAFSVEDINAGATPWFKSMGKKHARIMAGTTLSDFARIVRRLGGCVRIQN